MGIDNLSIVSMNSSRKGLFSMASSQRTPYLQRILDGAKPDICFLSGDDPSLKDNVVLNYSQYLTPSKNETVMLYNPNKVEMSQHQVSFNAFGPIPGMDMDKISCPLVEVKTLKPYVNVVKRFTVLAWKWDMFQNSGINSDRLLEGIVTFAQRLASTANTPILIGGEIEVSYETLKLIVNNRNQKAQQDFMSVWQPEMKQHGYLPSMTNASTTELRHKFKLDVFRCKPSNTSSQVVSTADCFIASKELEFSEPSLMDVERVTGRKIQMKALKEHCPTQTSMTIPARPPRHHGG